MFLVWNQIQEYRWGHLVGPPYIASPWLGSFWATRAWKGLNIALTGFVMCVARLAWFWLTNGSIVLCAHFCAWRGSMLYKAFVLYFMDPIQIIANSYACLYCVMLVKLFFFLIVDKQSKFIFLKVFWEFFFKISLSFEVWTASSRKKASFYSISLTHTSSLPKTHTNTHTHTLSHTHSVREN